MWCSMISTVWVPMRKVYGRDGNPVKKFIAESMDWFAISRWMVQDSLETDISKLFEFLLWANVRHLCLYNESRAVVMKQQL